MEAKKLSYRFTSGMETRGNRLAICQSRQTTMDDGKNLKVALNSDGTTVAVASYHRDKPGSHS